MTRTVLNPSQNLPEARAPRKLFVTDFDGTLLRSDGLFMERDLAALEHLQDLGVTVAIATGRSLHSLSKAAPRRLPVDYIISSTGAGLSPYPEGTLIRKAELSKSEVERAVGVLRRGNLDFMIQNPLPHNHRFLYSRATEENPDFSNRIEYYRQFCGPLGHTSTRMSASQLIAVLPPGDPSGVIREIRKELPDLSVIQATSPLDGRSTWVEIFPPGVSKSDTAECLCEILGIARENVMAVGNDYNDLDLLNWAGHKFVVENAPHDLKSRFPVVASNDNGGVADAVMSWLAN